ncbi:MULTISPECIES: signal peptidase II [Microbacterium]|uniref:Lipoprotein signal peptidase n=1 Tax=Microbacterium flavum TaxID=415216 RepID=A0ABS5XTK7_9MICO|nr:MULTISPECIES: signal peptidase II [Microbacterium]MBT8797861.1 signal peptidase II [Microbacterium flavum]MCX6503336.1 signal peptidase II [Microbacterium sp.]
MSPDQARRFALACIAAAGVVLIDQASKAAAFSTLTEDERIPLLGDLLGLQLAFNPGALLSLGSGATWLLTLLGVAATAVLIVAATRARTTGWAVGIGLILGGAIGNLIDRLFAPPAFGRGHVTDFLAYGNWFIGNLADVALGAGVIILGGSLWIRHRRTHTTATDDPTAPATSVEAGR